MGEATREELFQLMPELNADHIKIEHSGQLLEKLKAFRTNGVDKLQVITDYDMTLSKHHVNGVLTLSSFGLLRLCKGLEDIMQRSSALREKFLPIEFDPNLSREEKSPHMDVWYGECDKLYNGLVMLPEDMVMCIKERQPVLRDGAVDLLRSLSKNNVPVLVLSAGLGDVIKTVLEMHNLEESDTFRIVSNFFKWENGVVRGFGNHENGKFIHPYNKSGLGCVNYFKDKVVAGRSNVILMGDSIGDASMDEGVPEVENVIKIGFLYGSPDYMEQSLTKYTKHFDIVLLDDQTMAVPQAIFNFVSQVKNI